MVKEQKYTCEYKVNGFYHCNNNCKKEFFTNTKNNIKNEEIENIKEEIKDIQEENNVLDSDFNEQLSDEITFGSICKNIYQNNDTNSLICKNDVKEILKNCYPCFKDGLETKNCMTFFSGVNLSKCKYTLQNYFKINNDADTEKLSKDIKELISNLDKINDNSIEKINLEKNKENVINKKCNDLNTLYDINKNNCKNILEEIYTNENKCSGCLNIKNSEILNTSNKCENTGMTYIKKNNCLDVIGNKKIFRNHYDFEKTLLKIKNKNLLDLSNKCEIFNEEYNINEEGCNKFLETITNCQICSNEIEKCYNIDSKLSFKKDLKCDEISNVLSDNKKINNLYLLLNLKKNIVEKKKIENNNNFISKFKDNTFDERLCLKLNQKKKILALKTENLFSKNCVNIHNEIKNKCKCVSFNKDKRPNFDKCNNSTNIIDSKEVNYNCKDLLQDILEVKNESDLNFYNLSSLNEEKIENFTNQENNNINDNLLLKYFCKGLNSNDSENCTQLTDALDNCNVCKEEGLESVKCIKSLSGFGIKKCSDLFKNIGIKNNNLLKSVYKMSENKLKNKLSNSGIDIQDSEMIKNEVKTYICSRLEKYYPDEMEKTDQYEINNFENCKQFIKDIYDYNKKNHCFECLINFKNNTTCKNKELDYEIDKFLTCSSVYEYLEIKDLNEITNYLKMSEEELQSNIKYNNICSKLDKLNINKDNNCKTNLIDLLNNKCGNDKNTNVRISKKLTCGYLNDNIIKIDKLQNIKTLFSLFNLKDHFKSEVNEYKHGKRLNYEKLCPIIEKKNMTIKSNISNCKTIFENIKDKCANCTENINQIDINRNIQYNKCPSDTNTYIDGKELSCQEIMQNLNLKTYANLESINFNYENK